MCKYYYSFEQIFYIFVLLWHASTLIIDGPTRSLIIHFGQDADHRLDQMPCSWRALCPDLSYTVCISVLHLHAWTCLGLWQVTSSRREWERRRKEDHVLLMVLGFCFDIYTCRLAKFVWTCYRMACLTFRWRCCSGEARHYWPVHAPLQVCKLPSSYVDHMHTWSKWGYESRLYWWSKWFK
jgi:hypothetical protein